MRAFFVTLFITGIPFTTCFTAGDGIICSTEFVYGVNVTLTDAQTGQAVTGAELRLISGTGTELMTEFPAPSGVYVGAGEQPGTYSLNVQADGYQQYNQSDIVVEADECHVIPVSLQIQLNPL